jgi:hypothetical protein
MDNENNNDSIHDQDVSDIENQETAGLQQFQSLRDGEGQQAPPNFVCPVSNVIIKQAVQTPCNHVFDKMSLLDWYDDRTKVIIRMK